MIVKYLRHLKSQHSMWTRNSIFIHVKIIFFGMEVSYEKKKRNQNNERNTNSQVTLQ